MISISKAETKWLRAHGVPMGENGISKTHGHNTKYYLCESDDNMELMAQYNDEVRGIEHKKPKKRRKTSKNIG